MGCSCSYHTIRYSLAAVDHQTDRFGMSYRGLMALQAGVLVALTQSIPEHQVLLFGVLGVRVKVISLVKLGLTKFTN